MLPHRDIAQVINRAIADALRDDPDISTKEMALKVVNELYRRVPEFVIKAAGDLHDLLANHNVPDVPGLNAYIGRLEEREMRQNEQLAQIRAILGYDTDHQGG